MEFEAYTPLHEVEPFPSASDFLTANGLKNINAVKVNKKAVLNIDRLSFFLSAAIFYALLHSICLINFTFLVNLLNFNKLSPNLSN